MVDSMGLVGSEKTRLLIFEFVTGGGMAGETLPESWATEGSAMRRALARDFAHVPGLMVEMTLDARLPRESVEGVRTIYLSDHSGPSRLASLLCENDLALIVAPESDGILEQLSSETRGSIGCRAEAIRLTGDKLALGQLWRESGIRTPETVLVSPGEVFNPVWSGPTIVKPRWGAGSVDTVVYPPGYVEAANRANGERIAQPYVSGASRSASFLVDAEDEPTLLGVGFQEIQVDRQGSVSYHGGAIEAGVEAPDEVVRGLKVATRFCPGGFRGFVGVDYLVDDRNDVWLLEINPRPTTSYVALPVLHDWGTIASAWLAGLSSGLSRTEWAERLAHPASAGGQIRFRPDGTLMQGIQGG